VVSLVPGGPADLSGKISPEDRIIAVAQANEESVDAIDMPLSKVVRMIRGPKDSIVKLTVLKGLKGVGGIPTDIEIKRDIVKLKDQEAGGEIIEKEVDGKKIKLGVISLESFYFDWEGAENGQKEIKSSTSDVKKILDRFNAEKIDGLILDLRANGGGSLYEAITLTGLFIKSGPIVQIKTRENRTEVKGDVDNEIAYSGPMLVLVSRISASASEIFAGAMKDYNRAIIVGDAHTHGKGSVQTVFSLREILKYWGTDTDSGSVKITNAKFYRINGESTQKKGIVSDIILPFPADAMEMGESFLQNVLEWDKISPVTHSKWYPQELYTPVIAELKNNSEKRMASDPEFQKICSNIVFFQDEKKKNLVSLNEEKRIQSFLEEKERIDKQIKLFKIDEDEIQKDATGKDSKRNDDTYLKEAINIISDFITHSINKK
jgi:carboxyl-terminal processing protease